MRINPYALKAIKIKLAEYTKENGAIAEHVSQGEGCKQTCYAGCFGSCAVGCGGACVGVAK